MKHALWFTPLLIALPTLSMAENTSPWLPIPGETSVTLNYTQQEGDNAYIGADELSATDITGGGADSFERNNTALILGYGISDNLAVDAMLGYSEVDAGQADSDSGFTDSTVGLSWRLLDEFATARNIPTVTVRGAAIIKGDYDGERLAALGKEESGFQVSAIVGKQFNAQWGATAELGYEYRAGDVPEATFYNVAANFSPISRLGISVGYSYKSYGGDLDIGGPGFSPARFQEVNEERELVKLTVGYAFAANQGVAFTYGTLVDGRNTVADDDILSLTYTLAL